jgi:hypothetical protein|tara:strand:+ start:850 stop:1029 length:180 start_codon:yes stop_codon:yes gene_type:complete
MQHDRNELIKSLSSVWDVLHMAREDCISEGIESNDEQWNEVTNAMAKIHEALDIKHEEV